MGFTPEEVRRLNFKVQAGNVIDADSGSFWYQSKLENLPAVLPRRILSQYNTVTSNVPTGTTYQDKLNDLIGDIVSGPLTGIVENELGDPFNSQPTVPSVISTRLSKVTTGLDNTWIAWNNYNTPSSGRKDLWVSPPSVPDSTGTPSNVYE